MRLVIAIVACLASACSTATAVSTVFLPLEGPRAAVAPSRVELVFSGHVDRPYREVGLANINVGPATLGFTSVPPPTQTELLGTLRTIAASHGCDALLVNPTAYTKYQSITSAVCIAYR
jgi:hypothetical protein